MPPDLKLAPLPTNFVGAFDLDSIRVVLADDHTAMRRNLTRLLAAEDGVRVVAEAIDLETAGRHVHAYLPNVLLLDLRLPNGSSMTLVRELGHSVAETQVVVLTMENSPASSNVSSMPAPSATYSRNKRTAISSPRSAQPCEAKAMSRPRWLADSSPSGFVLARACHPVQIRSRANRRAGTPARPCRRAQNRGCALLCRSRSSKRSI